MSDRAPFSTPALRNAKAIRAGDIDSVLIVRLSSMGDIIHALPAVSALRQASPELTIGWLIEERWSELLCSCPGERLMPRSLGKPLVDRVHFANFSGWRKAILSDETWRELLDCIHEVQRFRYEAVIDMQGAIRSAAMARLSGAPLRLGSTTPREGPSRMLYTHSVDPEGAHVVQHALSLVSAFAGRQLPHSDPQFPHDPEQHDWAETFLAAHDGKPFVVINPGAGWGAKCWLTESFGEVARALHERGMQVLINHGPDEEALATEVKEASRGAARLLKCSVGELIAVLRRAQLFIGGDTGPMHLAAALHVPVVALFGPTKPERNGPFATPSVVLRDPRSMNNSSHLERRDEGLVSIAPAEVIAATEALLGSHMRIPQR